MQRAFPPGRTLAILAIAVSFALGVSGVSHRADCAGHRHPPAERHHAGMPADSGESQPTQQCLCVGQCQLVAYHLFSPVSALGSPPILASDTGLPGTAPCIAVAHRLPFANGPPAVA